MKIVINTDFGGFRLSSAGMEFLNITSPYPANKDFDIVSENSYEYRTSSVLIGMVEALGVTKASGGYAILKIVEIPDAVDWTIEEHDGKELIAERHRKWN